MIFIFSLPNLCCLIFLQVTYFIFVVGNNLQGDKNCGKQLQTKDLLKRVISPINKTVFKKNNFQDSLRRSVLLFGKV
jgi:hypothetical protein